MNETAESAAPIPDSERRRLLWAFIPIAIILAMYSVKYWLIRHPVSDRPLQALFLDGPRDDPPGWPPAAMPLGWQVRAAGDLLDGDGKLKVDVPTVAVAAVVDQPNVLLVDAREDRERAVSILPGAISLATLDADPALAKDRIVVVYCTIGVRSADATKRLRDQGINAANLYGGILAWIDAKQPVIDPKTGQPTKRVHTYGKQWAIVPPDYTAVY